MRLVNDSFDFASYVQSPSHTEKVVDPVVFKEGVYKRFFSKEITQAPTLPWAKTHNDVRFRPGETSIWAGINGHGKSLITGQVALDLARQGQKVCIASFEMPGEITLARLIRQACGGPDPTEAYIDRFLDWATGKIWIFDQEGVCDQKILKGVIRYAALERGVQHFFIDSLMKVVRSETDYDAQKNWVDEVIAIGKDTGIHIHVVAHIRKGDSEYDVPDKFDIKGSGSIVDQVDNTFIIWRNKKKEEQLRMPNLKPEDQEKLEKIPDCLMVVAKQRNYEWEGKIGLYTHAKSMSYVEGRHTKFTHFELNANPENGQYGPA